jgi:Flp pilus assembly pilin Flp
MITSVRQFLAEDRGQDLIEYTLLLAFVALASAALLVGTGVKVKSIWTTTNTTLSQAASTAGTT